MILLLAFVLALLGVLYLGMVPSSQWQRERRDAVILDFWRTTPAKSRSIAALAGYLGTTDKQAAIWLREAQEQ